MKKLDLGRILACAMMFFLASQAYADELETSLQELSGKLSSQLVEENVQKVAVVGFSDLNGYKSALGDFVSEEIVTSLIAAGGFDVVERRELDRVLSEQSEYTEGIFDRSTTAELQKLLGIDALITGSITNLGDRVKINARAISVETARAFAAASVSLEKDETIDQLLGQVAGGSVASSGQTEAGFRVQSSQTYFKNSFLHIVPTAVSVSADGKQLRIATEFRNVSSKAIQIGFKKQGSLSASAISNGGDEFLSSSVTGISTVGTAKSIRADPQYYTTIDEGSHAVVIWMFNSGRGEKIKGTSFAISGELFQLTASGSKAFSVGLSGLQL